MVVMAVLTGVYVIIGGYMATAWNDLIQGIIMLFGIIAVIAAVLSGHGGFMAAVKELAQVPSSVMPGAYASFLGPDPANLFGVVILTSLGTWGLPQMIQKFYAIKDEKAVHTGTIISTLFAIVVSGGCYFLGGFSRISGVKRSSGWNGKIRHHHSYYAVLSAGHPDRNCDRAGFVGVHVYFIQPGADFQFHVDTGFYQASFCEKK